MREPRAVDVAARAGVDAIKFQTFKAERLYPRSAGTSDYLGSETPIFEIIRSLEMPEKWLGELRDHAWSSGLAFLSTPFHVEAVELLDQYVDAFKIASYELTHDPLLEAVAAAKGELLSSLARLEKRRQQQRLRELSTEISRAQRLGDPQRLERLLLEKSALSRALHGREMGVGDRSE